MKKFIQFISFLIVACAANAQGYVEAMLNYAGTSSSGGTPVYSSIYASINGPVGWTFQPTTDISVTALGAFDYLVPSHGNLQVGLWNSGGTLLASQTINTASALVDQSLYSSITPLLLLAGETYYMAAYSAAGPLMAVAVTPGSPPNGYATMSPEIQLGMVAYSAGSGFSFPGTTDGVPGDAIVAPNFEFQPVPEPAALTLVGWVMVGLFTIKRSVHCRTKKSVE